MFIACNRTYYEIGDSVVQHKFEGAPAKVVAMKQHPVTGVYMYTLEVDVSNHPEGFDENGDRVATMGALVEASEITLA